jgi:hypothetical protein
MLASGYADDDARRRAVDTWLYIYELIDHGLDSAVGEVVVQAMQRQRATWELPDSDYWFLLNSFVIHPIRLGELVDREKSPKLRESMSIFFAELGLRIGVNVSPSSFAETLEAFTQYEMKNLERSDAGDRLFAHNRSSVLNRYPPLLRTVAFRMIEGLFTDRAAEALGLRIGRVDRLAATGTLKVRARMGRRSSEQFSSGMPNSTYPAGYTVSDLGPM